MFSSAAQGKSAQRLAATPGLEPKSLFAGQQQQMMTNSSTSTELLKKPRLTVSQQTKNQEEKVSERIQKLVGNADAYKKIVEQEKGSLKKTEDRGLKNSIFESIKLKHKPKLQKNTRPNKNAWVEIDSLKEKSWAQGSVPVQPDLTPE